MTAALSLDTNSQFQYVPVPNQHVPAVLAYLGTLVAAPATTAAPASMADEPNGPGTQWSDDDLVKLVTLPTKTSTLVARVLELLSETPGKDAALSTRELADALGEQYTVLKALPTQMKRVNNARFNGLHSPYWGLWGTSDFVPAREDVMYFAVTEARAEQWKRLRAGRLADLFAEAEPAPVS